MRTVTVGLWVVLVVASISASANAILIDTLPVGNLGNTGKWSGAGYGVFGPDNVWYGGYGPDRACGAVGYAYNVGKYEVTAGQYTAFLTAVAGVDTYALYNTNMSKTTDGSGISRSGNGTVGAPYTYAVAPAFAGRPVNYVSFWDACRFANWLHNQQPTGSEGPGTTETGAYTLTPGAINGNTILRNADWQWAVTSEDEWYKTAYHKNDGATGNYWNFPTRSNVFPGRNLADPSGNDANCYASSPYPIDSGIYTTAVGEFQNSASAYGTFDQGGNVHEWNESTVTAASRGLRGGSFFDWPDRENAAYRGYSDPTAEYHNVGFRVVNLPEPATFVLLTLGGLSLLLRPTRRHSRHGAAPVGRAR